MAVQRIVGFSGYLVVFHFLPYNIKHLSILKRPVSSLVEIDMLAILLDNLRFQPSKKEAHVNKAVRIGGCPHTTFQCPQSMAIIRYSS